MAEYVYAAVGDVYVCGNCAAGITNDDWSHLDYSHSPTVADRIYKRRIKPFLAKGWLEYSGYEQSEEFQCPCCQLQIDEDLDGDITAVKFHRCPPF